MLSHAIARFLMIDSAISVRKVNTLHKDKDAAWCNVHNRIVYMLRALT